MKRLSIFVSGGGTNLQRIAEYFAENPEVEIANVICNNPNAYAIERAKNLGIPCKIINRAEFKSEDFSKELLDQNIDLIVLAGFLWLVPQHLIEAFPNKIINIHHSFLPAFVGAKPYHAAFERGVKLIGATSHYVTSDLDAGPIIEQDITRISHKDTIDNLIGKGRDLEKIVLSRAVAKHIERKILVYKNKTIVFN